MTARRQRREGDQLKLRVFLMFFLDIAREKVPSWKVTHTLLQTNISPTKTLLKMIFLFPRWDMWSFPGHLPCKHLFFRGVMLNIGGVGFLCGKNHFCLEFSQFFGGSWWSTITCFGGMLFLNPWCPVKDCKILCFDLWFGHPLLIFIFGLVYILGMGSIIQVVIFGLEIEATKIQIRFLQPIKCMNMGPPKRKGLSPLCGTLCVSFKRCSHPLRQPTSRVVTYNHQLPYPLIFGYFCNKGPMSLAHGASPWKGPVWHVVWPPSAPSLVQDHPPQVRRLSGGRRFVRCLHFLRVKLLLIV